jgi:hypothetical protein
MCLLPRATLHSDSEQLVYCGGSQMCVSLAMKYE